jgi:hypothetical protein
LFLCLFSRQKFDRSQPRTKNISPNTLIRSMKLSAILLIFSIAIIAFVFIRTVMSDRPLFGPGPFELEPFETSGNVSATSNSAKSGGGSSGKKDDKLFSMPLKEYAMMASFNSAYDGTAVTAEQLSEVIARGYRFIDLNVFVGQNDKNEKTLYVGYSPDNAPTISSNTLTFTKALEIINKEAFVKTESSKTRAKARIPLTSKTVNAANGVSLGETYIQYPLFLHLRVYRAENSNVDVVGEIAKEMETHRAGTTWYHREGSNGAAISVDGSTILSTLQKKIVVSMDILNLIQVYAPTSDPVATNIPEPVRANLRKFVNVFTGGHTWRAFYHYGDISLENTKLLRTTDNGDRTNVTNMYVAYPYKTDKSNPPSAKEWARKHSIQTVPIRVYLEDEGQEETEAFFEDMKKPMVPMSYCLLGDK